MQNKFRRRRRGAPNDRDDSLRPELRDLPDAEDGPIRGDTSDSPEIGDAQSRDRVPDSDSTQILLTIQKKYGSDLVEQVLNNFFMESPRRFSSMREAVSEKNYEKLTRVAHTYKGSCKILGIRHMAEFCEEMEELAEGNALEGAEALLKKMEAEFQRVKTEIEAGPWR